MEEMAAFPTGLLDLRERDVVGLTVDQIVERIANQRLFNEPPDELPELPVDDVTEALLSGLPELPDDDATETVLSGLDQVELQNRNRTAVVHENSAVKRFNVCMRKLNIECDLACVNTEQLGKYLRIFYGLLRKDDCVQTACTAAEILCYECCLQPDAPPIHCNRRGARDRRGAGSGAADAEDVAA